MTVQLRLARAKRDVTTFPLTILYSLGEMYLTEPQEGEELELELPGEAFKQELIDGKQQCFCCLLFYADFFWPKVA